MTFLNQFRVGAIVKMSLRVEAADGTIENVDIEVSVVAPDLDRVSSGGVVRGFVRDAGRNFVASAGQSLDHAAESGRHHLWDHAATQLLSSPS